MEKARRIILFEPVSWSMILATGAVVLKRLPGYYNAKENQW
jgi:hypothetical protein